MGKIARLEDEIEILVHENKEKEMLLETEKMQLGQMYEEKFRQVLNEKTELIDHNTFLKEELTAAKSIISELEGQVQIFNEKLRMMEDEMENETRVLTEKNREYEIIVNSLRNGIDNGKLQKSHLAETIQHLEGKVFKLEQESRDREEEFRSVVEDHKKEIRKLTLEYEVVASGNHFQDDVIK